MVVPHSQRKVLQCLQIFRSGTDSKNRAAGGVLPRINIGADVWGESSSMTGVYERWCSSTLHIGWGLCDRLCLVLVCRGRYGLGGVVLLFILGSNLGGVGTVRGLRGGGRGGRGGEWARRG
jgi:hypothetical protein